MRRSKFLLNGIVAAIVVQLGVVCLPWSASAETREVVLLYTNDFHSAIDPIPAYWLEGEPPPNLGGAAELMTFVEQIREREAEHGNPVFLFDTGDMFTGMLSKLTSGEALIEMMTTLRYDAMAIGNHEFDYGWQNFRNQMFRAAFPILGANIFYMGTDIPFAPPHAILERDGVRIGVIGIIGEDARSVVLPSFVTELDFRDPAEAVARSVADLEKDVDLIVVLAHQGHTGPMQTDAEAHPELQRDFEEDIALSGKVSGIGVFVGGHAHRGIEVPFVHPDTGTLIVQTYGYGTRLGYLKVVVDTEEDRIVSHEGELLKVWSNELDPHPFMSAKMDAYKEEVAPVIGRVVGRADVRLIRSYNTESLLGAFTSDVIREYSDADVGLMNAGGLRADLPRGEITRGNVLDALPFVNTIVVLEMTGEQIEAVLEQGFTLLRGMIQVSGIEARYDLTRPMGSRLISASIGGESIDASGKYRVATNSFLAQGGDLYETFLDARTLDEGEEDMAQLVIAYLESRPGAVPAPTMGRLAPVSSASP